jgi:hypothetical protein
MNQEKTIDVLDVEKVTLSSPQSAVKTFNLNHPYRHVKCDVVIAGGGVGGIAAAIALTRRHPHLKVCLTEETDWLGGQMTAQGVSALDENYLIETSGSCRSYQNFRRSVRAIYESYKLSNIGKAQPYLNPGTSWVTYLAFEPKHALKVLEESLNPAISSGALQIFKRTKVVALDKDKTELLTVDLESGKLIAIESKICLDATELGDLLPLAGLPYRLGSDSRSDTGEKHTPVSGNRENVQDFVYPFVIDFKPGTSNVIEKPPHYEKFAAAGKFSFNGYKMFEESTLQDEGNRVVPPFWTYRRLIARENFDDPLYPFDIAMINWDSNDLRGHNIIDQKPAVQAERLALAKSLSLGFLYWLQTKAPRDEGGSGYPELELRMDVLGTNDGLSKYPYIREARRIVPVKTIVEQDIVASENPGARAKHMKDTLGIGLYPVDIHGMQEVPGAAQATKPFQIPLSALIPESGGTLLPACKNIGVTHLTNGAYRLHPVEWAIGEAQAEVTAYCLKHHLQPTDVLSAPAHLLSVQRALIEGGSPLVWFDDVSTEDPNFAAIQYCALTELIPWQAGSLHFDAAAPVTVEEALRSLATFFNWKTDTAFDTTQKSKPATSNKLATNDVTVELSSQSIGSADNCGRVSASVEELLVIAHKEGYFVSVTAKDIKSGVADSELTGEQMCDIAKKSKFSLPEDINTAGKGNHISRGQFARWLYAASSRKEKA